jgi:hypothetical protein
MTRSASGVASRLTTAHRSGRWPCSDSESCRHGKTTWCALTTRTIRIWSIAISNRIIEPRHTKATFRKDRRLNIRLSSKDLEAIQKRALAEGLPYQTLISSLLHKYASGRLQEV